MRVSFGVGLIVLNRLSCFLKLLKDVCRCVCCLVLGVLSVLLIRNVLMLKVCKSWRCWWLLSMCFVLSDMCVRKVLSFLGEKVNL